MRAVNYHTNKILIGKYALQACKYICHSKSNCFSQPWNIQQRETISAYHQNGSFFLKWKQHQEQNPSFRDMRWTMAQTAEKARQLILKYTVCIHVCSCDFQKMNCIFEWLVSGYPTLVNKKRSDFENRNTFMHLFYWSFPLSLSLQVSSNEYLPASIHILP